MSKQSKYTAAEKREIVLQMLRQEEPNAQLARRYEVSENALYIWRDRFVEGGQAALESKNGVDTESRRRVRELEKQLEESNRTIGEITIANNLLKKIRDGNL